MSIDNVGLHAISLYRPPEHSFARTHEMQERPLPDGDTHRVARSRAEAPLVSVVIPTRNRPLLAERAVRSALDQSLRGIEVVVVIDGPDAETQERLDQVRDERLNVLCLPRNVGGSEARNIGIRYSRGKWIALLDDDDEWLPEKLLKQWNAGESAAADYAFVASEFIESTEGAERVLPRRMPAAGEKFSDYMFARRGWNSGEGFLQTSTWFVSRSLMTRVQFTRGLKRCQDLDWLLRATAFPETAVTVVPEVLAIFHHEEHGERVSRSADWRFLYDWASGNRRYFTPRAFSFFIATFCVPSAAKQRESAATFVFLLRQCFFRGQPGLRCLLLFFICWCMPEARRRTIRVSFEGFRVAMARAVSAVSGHPLPGKAV